MKKQRVKFKESAKRHDPKIEAIKVTIEKKKQCNAKALEIVTSFSEGTISEDCLLDNLQFISQEHYQDIVEERAINKYCGYPLCSKNLKNIPAKQYHISTTLNKVFDITDRKNFCSNLCYKASKYLKDQVSTSPLWLRENQSPTFSLISLQSKGGISGDEVDLGIISIKKDSKDILPGDNRRSTELYHSIDFSVPDTPIGSTENNTHSPSCNSSIAENFTINYNEDLTLNSSFGHVENESLSNICTKPFDQKHLNNACELTFTEKQEINNHSGDRSLSFDLSSNGIGHNSGLKTSDKNTNKEMDSKRNLNKDSALPSTSVIDNTVISKPHKHFSKVKKVKRNMESLQGSKENIVLKIEQVLREWISIDSLCLLFGEDKIKEILKEKSSSIASFYNTASPSQDFNFYERYQAICRKLNILELEDTKVDSSFREEIKKPLPDYDVLKEETIEMDIKVKMFYKGDRVKFEEHDGNVKMSESEKCIREPILPLVDLHAQKALRRRIVIDKFMRVFQDLPKTLGLDGFNFKEDVRSLISTFSLAAHNITMKPAEWNLISIIIIKLLSIRDKNLEKALYSSPTNKHLTLLLMSYSLDGGYLDRLMVWLTDVEAVLHKY